MQQLLASVAVPTAYDVLLAAKGSPEAFLQHLIAAAVDATAASFPSGSTALHYAAARGFSEATIQQLIAAGAAADCRTRDGQTALHLAAAAGQPQAARALIAAGADVMAASTNGLTPMHTLAEARPIVLSHPGQADVVLDNQRAGIWEGRKQAAQLLLVHGADINAAGPDFSWPGQACMAAPPLYCAASCSEAEAVQLLLELGARVDAAARGVYKPSDSRCDVGQA